MRRHDAAFWSRTRRGEPYYIHNMDVPQSDMRGFYTFNEYVTFRFSSRKVRL